MSSRRLATGLAVSGVLGIAVWFSLGMHRGVVLSSDIKGMYYPWKGTHPVARAQTTWDSDPVWQFAPWVELARSELLAGRLPLWNPYQDGGVPLLGNSISALGSPLLWPAVLLGVARGWNLSLLARVLCAAVCAFLFFRDRGRSRLAAALGALPFSLSGPFVAWLEHPQTMSAAAVPLLLMYVGRAAGATTTAASPAGIALATALVLLGGHPETALMAAILVGGYALAMGGAARTFRTIPPALAGAGLAAPLLLPFVEYYFSSLVRTGGHRGTIVLPISDLARFAFVEVPGSHKVEAAATVSLAVLLLAPVALLSLRRDRETAFWAAVTVSCLAVAYDTPIARALASSTPVYWSRVLLFLPLALGALAASALDALRERARRAGRERAAGVAAALLVVTAAAELLLAARGFHGVTSAGLLGRSTPLLSLLSADRDVFRVLPLHDVLPANSATELRLEDVRGYDAIAPLGWRRQRAAIGEFAGLPTTADALEPWSFATGRALDSWNVKYVATPPWDRLRADALNGAYGFALTEVYSGPDGKLFRNERVLPRVRLSGPGSARIRERSPTRWVIEVSAETASTLVVANPFFPGWQVAVDGRPHRTDREPGAPISVPVPAGEHVVTLRYRPALFHASLGIALLSAVLVGLGARRARGSRVAA